MSKKLIKLIPSRMPNFIRAEGWKEPIPVKELSEQEAQEYAELMKQAFIEHWKNKQSNN